MGATLIFSLALWALSLGLALWHIYERRAVLTESDPREFTFLKRQFRRRMMICTLLALVGLSLLSTLWFAHPLTVTALWLVVLALLAAVCLLALGDWAVTRNHYLHSVARLRTAEAVLRAELKRLQKESPDEE